MDLISRQAAIDALAEQIMESALMDNPTTASTDIDRYRPIAELSLRDVPSAEPEPTDCEYCHEDSDGYVKPIEKNNHAFVRFGMDGWELDLKANGWHGSAKIRYCPMCGRELKNG